jgi:hypothetical protein
MKRYLYMFLLLLLLIVPATGQKTGNTSWRNACRTECARKNNVCLQEAQGDGPKKEACERQFRACRYNCDNPARRAAH